MVNWLKCKIFGHIKYNPNALNGSDLLELNDYLDNSLVKVNVCARCGAVYSNLKTN